MKTASYIYSRLGEVDWDFSGTKSSSAFSAIHWHPSRFVSQLPATLIGLLSSPGELVLDPFSGSGTTVTEAQRLGRKSIGVDISPVSSLICRAKTIDSSAETIRKEIGKVRDAVAESMSRDRLTMDEIREVVPAGVQLSKWYSRGVRSRLARIWTALQPLEGTARVMGDMAFSATLLPVCRETRHWGYVCDNTEPKDEREADVALAYLAVLDRMEEAYRLRDDEVRERFGRLSIAESRVVSGDAKQALADQPSGGIDLVVTSPPYFGVCDYVKAQRLSMEWFGWEIEPLRLAEIGARSKRHRQSARASYVSEIVEVLKECSRLCKPGGHVALVFGESKTRGPVIAQIKKAMTKLPLDLVFESGREVSMQRRQAPSIRAERLIVYRKGDL